MNSLEAAWNSCPAAKVTKWTKNKSGKVQTPLDLRDLNGFSPYCWNCPFCRLQSRWNHLRPGVGALCCYFVIRRLQIAAQNALSPADSSLRNGWIFPAASSLFAAACESRGRDESCAELPPGGLFLHSIPGEIARENYYLPRMHLNSAASFIPVRRRDRRGKI
jgi:hypothetical protein